MDTEEALRMLLLEQNTNTCTNQNAASDSEASGDEYEASTGPVFEEEPVFRDTLVSHISLNCDDKNNDVGPNYKVQTISKRTPQKSNEMNFLKCWGSFCRPRAQIFQ